MVEHLVLWTSDMAPDKRLVSGKYFFLFLHKNICCGYSLEAPRQGHF